MTAMGHRCYHIAAFMALAALLVTGCVSGSSGNAGNSDATPYRILSDSEEFPLFDPYAIPEEPVFDIVTTMGTIRVKLYKETPLHRDNFARLVAGRILEGTLFHRVIDGFMIQGGDPGTKDPETPQEEYGMRDLGYWIPAEFVEGIRHTKGALAAAREGDDINPDKASSSTQFYLVQSEEGCKHLDGSYTVFGQTIGGMEVIDRIAAVPRNGHDVPDDPVTILSIRMVK